MSREVRVLCRPAVASGFRLAGIPVELADDAADAEARVAALHDAGTVGLLLVEDRLFTAMQATRRSPRSGLPITVPFPGPSWDEKRVDDRVIEILRRAIGYRVRLR